jgi:hypothetical protein
MMPPKRAMNVLKRPDETSEFTWSCHFCHANRSAEEDEAGGADNDAEDADEALSSDTLPRADASIDKVGSNERRGDAEVAIARGRASGSGEALDDEAACCCAMEEGEVAETNP